MQFSSSIIALTLASFAAANPMVRRSVWNEANFGGVGGVVFDSPSVHFPATHGAWYPGSQGGWFPGSGSLPGGGFPPSGGNGGTPPASGGNGGTPPASGGNGGTPPASGGNGGTPPASGGNGSTPPASGGNGGTPPASGGNGSTPPASGGNGSTPPASGGNGSTPPASGGNSGSSNKNACGVTPGQISALTPLLNKLGLSTTIDGVKQLVDKLLFSVGGLLESGGVNGSGGLVDVVNNVVQGLLGQPLELHNTVDAVTSILENQVPCLLDTLLPKP